MLATSMVYSRVRYVCNVMSMPEHIADALEQDTQALIWGKLVDFDAEEEGTNLASRRWMKRDSQFGNIKDDLGLGVMPWDAHNKALQIKWLLRYRDASGGAWKAALDVWFERTHVGRGGAFSRVDIKELTKSTTQRRSQLPSFWRDALRALREIELSPAVPVADWNKQTAGGLPLWHNPIFTVSTRVHVQTWTQKLQLNRLRDLVKDDGSDYTDADIVGYFDAALPQYANHYYKVGPQEYVSQTKLLDEWKSIRRSVPQDLQDALTRSTSAPGVYSAVARKLMAAAGWTYGQPLKPGGLVDPIGTTKPRTKTAQSSKIKAVILAGKITYGRITAPGRFEAVELSTAGRPLPTTTIAAVTPDEVRDTVVWGGGVAGMADDFYPSPEDWRLGAIDAPLDKVTVKMLTKEISSKTATPPSCKRAWEERLGKQIPWDLVGKRLNRKLLTPRDWMSYYKNVVHRSFMTNVRLRPGHPEEWACRCCRTDKESIQHFAKCPTLSPIWQKVGALAQTDATTELVLFGLTSDRKTVPEGISALLMLVWKFTLIQLTSASMNDTRVNTDNIWESAIARLRRKIKSKEFAHLKERRRMQGRGQEPKPPTAENKAVEGLGTFCEEKGTFKWNVEAEHLAPQAPAPDQNRPAT